MEALAKAVPVQTAPPTIVKQSANGETTYDYSHLLKKYADLGFRLHLTVGPKTRNITATLFNGKNSIGQTQLNWDIEPGTGEVHLKPWHTEVHEDWRGRKFGKAMYTAALIHAKSHLGATHLVNTAHSTPAMHMYKGLSKEFQLGYKPTPDFGPGKLARNRQEWLDMETGDFDGKWKGQKLALSEYDAHHVSTVSAWIVDHYGRVLWGRKRSGKWALPGGHVNRHEPNDGALRREVLEETGLKVKAAREVGTTSNENGVLIHLYLVVADGQPDPTQDPDREFVELHWVDVSRGLPPQIAHNLSHNPNKWVEWMGL